MLNYEYFLQLEKGMPEARKKSLKTEDRFTAISDPQSNKERVLFQEGTRNSVN